MQVPLTDPQNYVAERLRRMENKMVKGSSNEGNKNNNDESVFHFLGDPINFRHKDMPKKPFDTTEDMVRWVKEHKPTESVLACIKGGGKKRRVKSSKSKEEIRNSATQLRKLRTLRNKLFVRAGKVLKRRSTGVVCGPCKCRISPDYITPYNVMCPVYGCNASLLNAADPKKKKEESGDSPQTSSTDKLKELTAQIRALKEETDGDVDDSRYNVIAGFV